MGWGDGYPDNWDKIRKLVYKRDNYTCLNCGAKGGPFGNAELHADHIVPKSDGGSHHPQNLRTLCWRCHNARHDHHVPRMSSLGKRSSSSSRPSSSSSSTSPGHNPSSMDADTRNLRDIYMDVSRQEESTDSQNSSQSTSPDTTTADTDEGDDSKLNIRASQYACPNCDTVMERTGWYPYYCHFKDCELPSKRPPPLSESQWKKVKDKLGKSGSRGSENSEATPSTPSNDGESNIQNGPISEITGTNAAASESVPAEPSPPATLRDLSNTHRGADAILIWCSLSLVIMGPLLLLPTPLDTVVLYWTAITSLSVLYYLLGFLL